MSESTAGECCWNYPHATHETPCAPATPDAGDASEPLNLRADQVDIWRDAYRKGAEAGVAAERGRSASREAAAATRARAEALREAARDLPGLDTIRTHGDAANWLRARADSLTPDAPARTIPTTASVRAGLAADTAADNRVRWNRALKGGA